MQNWLDKPTKQWTSELLNHMVHWKNDESILLRSSESNEAMNQWINESHGSLRKWLSESMTPRSNESMKLMTQWITESMDQRIIEPSNQQINGSLNQWNTEATEQWMNVSKNTSHEPLNHWVTDSVNWWNNSSLNKRTHESLNDTAAWLGLMQWVNEPMQKWTNKSVSSWTKKSMNQWMDRWMNKWMGVWTDGWVSYFFSWAIPSLNGYLFSQLLLLWAASGLLLLPSPPYLLQPNSSTRAASAVRFATSSCDPA